MGGLAKWKGTEHLSHCLDDGVDDDRVSRLVHGNSHRGNKKHSGIKNDNNKSTLSDSAHKIRKDQLPLDFFKNMMNEANKTDTPATLDRIPNRKSYLDQSAGGGSNFPQPYDSHPRASTASPNRMIKDMTGKLNAKLLNSPWNQHKPLLTNCMRVQDIDDEEEEENHALLTFQVKKKESPLHSLSIKNKKSSRRMLSGGGRGRRHEELEEKMTSPFFKHYDKTKVESTPVKNGGIMRQEKGVKVLKRVIIEDDFDTKKTHQKNEIDEHLKNERGKGEKKVSLVQSESRSSEDLINPMNAIDTKQSQNKKEEVNILESVNHIVMSDVPTTKFKNNQPGQPGGPPSSRHNSSGQNRDTLSIMNDTNINTNTSLLDGEENEHSILIHRYNDEIETDAFFIENEINSGDLFTPSMDGSDISDESLTTLCLNKSPNRDEVPPDKDEVPYDKDKVPPNKDKVPPNKDRVPPNKVDVPPKKKDVPGDSQIETLNLSLTNMETQTKISCPKLRPKLSELILKEECHEVKDTLGTPKLVLRFVNDPWIQNKPLPENMFFSSEQEADGFTSSWPPHGNGGQSNMVTTTVNPTRNPILWFRNDNVKPKGLLSDAVAKVSSEIKVDVRLKKY